MKNVTENFKFLVSSTPHIREKNSIDDIMLDVIIALFPAMFAGLIIFGQRSLGVVLVSVLSCVAFEWLYCRIARKKSTIKDLSAVVTGMLIAFGMPATIPYYVVVVAAFFAIIITKQLFGGLGQNFMNPALAGRAFILAAFPAVMTSFPIERTDIFANIADTVTGATPLAAEYANVPPTVLEKLFGVYQNGNAIGGCLGESCSIALLIGFAYLLIRKVITPAIPLSYIGSVFVMSALFHDQAAPAMQNPLVAVMSGSVLLGAIFMATDYVTSPTTTKGQLIFGVGCGVITCIIRLWGGYPEGVTFAILLMNVLTPLIEKWTVPKPFGSVKEGK